MLKFARLNDFVHCDSFTEGRFNNTRLISNFLSNIEIVSIFFAKIGASRKSVLRTIDRFSINLNRTLPKLIF